MGKSFYRKYRSKTLDEVVGQEHVTDTLKNALKKGTISHAYLFTGPHGVGKTSVARLFAHAINELDYSEEATHLDIIEIDAASNRRIDEIRELRDKVHVAPTSAKYKVYIIDEVHMLTREAFNALLKTLEEPPEHAVFILATTEAHKIPDTIISRTQRFTFKPIRSEDAQNHLRTIADTEKIMIDDDALKLLALHGKGSFRDSISMLDQIAGFGKDKLTGADVGALLGVPSTDLIDELVSSVSSNDTEQLFSILQKLRTQGSHPSSTAKTLISTLRQQIIDGALTMNGNTAVQLMQQLLPLTATGANYDALEIVLLGVIDLSAVGQPKKTQLPQEKKTAIGTTQEQRTRSTEVDTSGVVNKTQPEKKQSTQKTEEPVSQGLSDKATEKTLEVEAPAEAVAVEPPTTQSAQDGWAKVLDALKGHHNTLYGVLRMAQMHESESEVTLTFQFGFHKKQVDQPKNVALVRKLVQQYIGSSHKLTLVVKSQANKPTTKVKKPSDGSLSNVSNIFGGAELLES